MATFHRDYTIMPTPPEMSDYAARNAAEMQRSIVKKKAARSRTYYGANDNVPVFMNAVSRVVALLGGPTIINHTIIHKSCVWDPRDEDAMLNVDLVVHPDEVHTLTAVLPKAQMPGVALDVLLRLETSGMVNVTIFPDALVEV